MNKKLLVIFGVLDFIAVVNNFSYAKNYFGPAGFGPVVLGFVLLYLSLPVSGTLLIKQKKAGIWINYVQFPLRLLFMVLSFGFLLRPILPLGGGTAIYEIMMWVITLLEVLRLVLTIKIHRKHY